MKARPEGLAVGRIVHYVAGMGSQCQPALIVATGEGTAVNLRVFHDGPASLDSHMPRVPFDDAKEPSAHTWHWPEPA